MKGCLFRIVLLPFIAGVVYLLLLLRLPFPSMVFPAEGAETAAVITGICVWFGLLSFLDIKRYKADLSMMNQGFLRDGERIIVSGVLNTDARLLKTPFSGKECIGYYYNVSRLTSSPGSTSGSSRWTYYEGCALVLASIKCTLGNMKILAEPDMELFHEVPAVRLADKIGQARNYLQTCSFKKEVSGLGDFRIDKKSGDPEALEKCDLDEKIIRQGERVVISGIYASEHGGIRAEPDSIMNPFHIIPEGEAVLKRKIRNRSIGIAVCFGIGSIAVIIYYLMFGNPAIW